MVVEFDKTDPTTSGESNSKSDGEAFADFQNPDTLSLIAGPHAIVSEAQIDRVISYLKQQQIKYIHCGADDSHVPPEFSPGPGEKGLQIVGSVAREAGIRVVAEIVDQSQIDMVYRQADVVQVGSHNMFNYALLAALGTIDKPVMLDRGIAATLDEWLQAAEYVSKGGNNQIILCERGIRTFEPLTRFTLDIAAISLARSKSGLPTIADPSHAGGRADLVLPLAMAAAAAGADGLLVEFHPDSDLGLAEHPQSLTCGQFDELMVGLAR